MPTALPAEIISRNAYCRGRRGSDWRRWEATVLWSDYEKIVASESFGVIRGGGCCGGLGMVGEI